MTDTGIPELTNKVIASAKVCRNSNTEQEIALEFTDGTSFSFCCASNIKSETSLYRGGVGEPQVIRNFES